MSPAPDLRSHIRDVPDFPRPGIVFKDITPLLLDAEALGYAVSELADYAKQRRADFIVSAEARGFALGGAVAVAAGAGFVLARKPGKLPREVRSEEYELEYGVDALEVHSDAVSGGARVLVHDDLLATGGTAAGMCRLIEQTGGEVVGCAFLAELAFLGGRGRLEGRDIRSLVTF